MKRSFVKPIALYATKKELSLFQLIKKHHNRTSNADMLRVLINQEAEKILKENNATATTPAR
ncbi:MAG: hypothetical protein IJT68_06395 [Lentisphaeria bacterium]|nr:hypothetical protein [Lentisphaeria bacterium]